MDNTNKPMSKLEENRLLFTLRKVNLWQEFKYVKHLTCANRNCNSCNLVPKRKRLKIVLECPNCKGIQSYVPKAILHSKLKILNTNTGKFVEDVSDLNDDTESNTNTNLPK